jgi:glycosyltransferase involved in cell wall biosynthesis
MRLTETVTPLKPLEAMAQGRILLASNVGGHRELIENGKTGYLFEADQTDDLAGRVVDVLQRKAEWPRIRAKGRKFVEEERTWRAAVARYEPVYHGILGSGRHRAAARA